MYSALFRILIVVLLISVILGLGLCAYASQTDTVSKDGITVILSTDKDSYSSSTEICVSLNVVNNSKYTALISSEVTPPDGISVSSGSAKGEVSLKRGRETTFAVELHADSPLSFILWTVGIIALLCAIGAAVFFGLKAHNNVSVIVCFILAGTVLLSAIPVQVQGASEQLNVSRTIMVDGKAVTVSASVSYELVTAEYAREDLENLLATTAWAYYLKEDKLQYCSQEITDGLSKYTGGNYRLTEDASPEYGTSDTTIYSVCSDFVYKVYYEALGHRLFDAENYLGSTTSDFWLKSEDVALMRWFNATYIPDELETELNTKYGVTKEKELSTEQARKFMENWKDNLRPGDVIVATGHAFLYVGNGYVMDCWGDKYTESTGLDQIEANGSVHVLHTVEDLFLNGTDPITQSFVIKHNSEKDWLVVFRPLDAFVKSANAEDKGKDVIDLDAMTVNPDKIDAAYTRLANPAMEIDRTVDVTPYGSVATGGKLAYSIAISNKSNDPDFLTYCKRQEENYTGVNYTGLVVTETIPEGTKVVDGSISHNGVLENGVITWTLDIAAGEVTPLSYQVEVTSGIGSTVVNNGGYVGDIPSNSIQTTVSGQKLSGEALAGLAQLAATPKAQWRELYNISKLGTDLEFAERVYQSAMGIGLELPTIQDILNNLFTFQTIQNESCSDRYPAAMTSNLFVLKDSISNEWNQVADMIVAGYYGGQKFYSSVRGTTINEFRFDYLESGDILVYANTDITGNPTYTEVVIYAGNGTLLVLDSNQTSSVLTASSHNNADHAYAKLWNALARGIFFILRPSEAYEDINKLAYDTSCEPVYGAEPPEESPDKLGIHGLNQEALDMLATLTAENVDFWNITLLDSNGTATLATQTGKYLSRVPGASNLRQSDTPVNWVITKDETTGYYTITNENEDVRYLSYNGTGFKAYAEASDTRYIQFMLIPAEEIGKEVDENTDAPVYELKTGKYAIVAMAGYQQYVLENTMQSENVYGATEVTVDDGILTPPYWTQKNTNFAEEVYKKLGIDITSGTKSTSIANILKTALFFDADGVEGYPYSYDLLATPAATYQQLSAMLVPELRGGPGMARYTDNLISIQDLVPGDVLNLINREDSRYWVCVYLGNGKLLTSEYTKNSRQTYKIYDFSQDTDGSEFKEFITNAAIGGFPWECYYVLRPSQGFYNINDPLYDPNLVTPELTTSTYAILAKVGNDYYALVADSNGYIVSANKVDYKAGVITGAYDIWTIDVKQNLTSGLTVSVACGNSYIYQKESGSSNTTLRNGVSSLTNWRLVYDKTAQCYRLQTTSGDGRYLMYSTSNNGFKVYADESSTQFGELMLVPVDPASVAKTDRYVLIVKAGDKYFAVSSSMLDSVTLGAVEVNYANGVFSGTNVDIWNMTQYGSTGNITLAATSGKYLTRAEGSSNLKLTDTAVNWTLVKDETTGMYTIRNSNGDTRYLSYNGTGFKAYTKASESRFIEFIVVPASEVIGVKHDTGDNNPSSGNDNTPSLSLENGKYHIVAVANGKYFAVGDTDSDGIVNALEVGLSNGKITTANAPAWTITVQGSDGSVTLTNSNGEYLIRASSKSNLVIGNTATTWIIAKDGEYYTIANANGDNRFLAYQGTGFKAYTKASDTRFIRFLLIPVSETGGSGDSGSTTPEPENPTPDVPQIDFESGKYHIVAVANGKYFAMSHTGSDGVVGALEVTLDNGKVTTANAPAWTVTVQNRNGAVTLTTPNGEQLIRAAGKSNLVIGNTATTWMIAKDGDYYTIANTNGDTRYLAYQGTGFKAYSAANNSRFIQFMLIPVPETEDGGDNGSNEDGNENEQPETPTFDLQTGKYNVIAIVGNKYFAMGNVTTGPDSGVICATEVTVTDGVLTSSDVPFWTMTVLNEDGTVTLTSGDKYLVRSNKSSNLDVSSNESNWKIVKKDNYYHITNTNSDTRFLAYQGTGFKAYAAASDTRFIQFLLIPVHEHSWNVGAVTKPADCSEEGVRTYTCSSCGQTRTEAIPTASHAEEVIPAVGATCTETGLTAGVKCSVCGEILTAQEIAPLLDHTQEVIPAVGATCTETGLTEGVKCSVCGEILTAQKSTAVLEHSWDSVANKCSICGQARCNADGHTEEVIPAVGATCTETGLTAGVKCSVCGEILTAQEEVPATNHTEETIPGAGATCTETGLTAGVKCSVCGEILTAQEEVPATNHTEETIPAAGATCTETGLTAGMKCSVCGEILTAQESTPMLEHSWDDVTGKCSLCGKPAIDLQSGNYAVIAVVGDKYYALGNTADSGVISAAELTIADGALTTASVPTWSISILDKNGTATLATTEGKYLLRTDGRSNLNIVNDEASWIITKDESGYYTISNTSSDSRFLAYNGTGFKAYAEASDTRFIQFMLIPVAETEEPLRIVENGNYMIIAVAGDKYYVMDTSGSNGVVTAKEVTVENGSVTASDVPYWHIEVLDEDGTAILTNADGNYVIRTKNSSNLTIGGTETAWIIAKEEDTGYYTFTNVNGDTRYLAYNGSGFKAYAAANDSRFIQFMLIPVSE